MYNRWKTLVNIDYVNFCGSVTELTKTDKKDSISNNDTSKSAYIQTEKKEKKVHSRIPEADEDQIRSEGLSKEKE